MKRGTGLQISSFAASLQADGWTGAAVGAESSVRFSQRARWLVKLAANSYTIFAANGLPN